MSKVAFELREDHADVFIGGSVALADLKTYDVKEALDAGGGKIVLSPEPDPKKAESDDESKRQAEHDRVLREQNLVVALDHFPALKRAAVDSNGSKSKSTAKDGESK